MQRELRNQNHQQQQQQSQRNLHKSMGNSKPSNMPIQSPQMRPMQQASVQSNFPHQINQQPQRTYTLTDNAQLIQHHQAPQQIQIPASIPQSLDYIEQQQQKLFLIQSNQPINLITQGSEPSSSMQTLVQQPIQAQNTPCLITQSVVTPQVPYQAIPNQSDSANIQGRGPEQTIVNKVQRIQGNGQQQQSHQVFMSQQLIQNPQIPHIAYALPIQQVQPTMIVENIQRPTQQQFIYRNSPDTPNQPKYVQIHHPQQSHQTFLIQSQPSPVQLQQRASPIRQEHFANVRQGSSPPTFLNYEQQRMVQRSQSDHQIQWQPINQHFSSAQAATQQQLQQDGRQVIRQQSQPLVSTSHSMQYQIAQPLHHHQQQQTQQEQYQPLQHQLAAMTKQNNEIELEQQDDQEQNQQIQSEEGNKNQQQSQNQNVINTNDAVAQLQINKQPMKSIKEQEEDKEQNDDDQIQDNYKHSKVQQIEDPEEEQIVIKRLSPQKKNYKNSLLEIKNKQSGLCSVSHSNILQNTNDKIFSAGSCSNDENILTQPKFVDRSEGQIQLKSESLNIKQETKSSSSNLNSSMTRSQIIQMQMPLQEDQQELFQIHEHNQNLYDIRRSMTLQQYHLNNQMVQFQQPGQLNRIIKQSSEQHFIQEMAPMRTNSEIMQQHHSLNQLLFGQEGSKNESQSKQQWPTDFNSIKEFQPQSNFETQDMNNQQISNEQNQAVNQQTIQQMMSNIGQANSGMNQGTSQNIMQNMTQIGLSGNQTTQFYNTDSNYFQQQMFGQSSNQQILANNTQHQQRGQIAQNGIRYRQSQQTQSTFFEGRSMNINQQQQQYGSMQVVNRHFGNAQQMSNNQISSQALQGEQSDPSSHRLVNQSNMYNNYRENLVNGDNLYSTPYYNGFIENLYFEPGDGEISIYYHHTQPISNGQGTKPIRLLMVTVIDIYTLYLEKRGKAIELIDRLSKINHPHLTNIEKWWYINDQAIFLEMESPINVLSSRQLNELSMLNYQGQIPSVIHLGQNEQNRAWKTYCKRKFSDLELFDVILQMASGLDTLHQHGFIHRDVHPQRIQLFHEPISQDDLNQRVIVKFNTVGMPFNFKKLLKRENFSGHVNYSAPELILEKTYFSNKVDVWSFGCCVYYMINKKDPFDGKTPQETKYNILNQQFDRNTSLNSFCNTRLQNNLIRKILKECLSLEDSRRPSFEKIVDLIKSNQTYSQFIQMNQNRIDRYNQSQNQRLQQQIILQQQNEQLLQLQQQQLLEQQQLLQSIDNQQLEENQSNQKNLDQQLQQDQKLQLITPTESTNYNNQSQQQEEPSSLQDVNNNESDQQIRNPLNKSIIDIDVKDLDLIRDSEPVKVPLRSTIKKEDEANIELQNPINKKTQKEKSEIIELDNKRIDIKGQILFTQNKNQLVNELTQQTTDEQQLYRVEHLANALLSYENQIEQPLNNEDLQKFFLSKNKDPDSNIFEELEQMPQKLQQFHMESEPPINIKKQAEKIIDLSKDIHLNQNQVEIIKNNEEFDAQLLPAIKVPKEVQDLRLIKEADNKDMQDWIETVVEILPEIQTDIEQLDQEKTLVDTSKTQIGQSILFKSQSNINMINTNQSQLAGNNSNQNVNQSSLVSINKCLDNLQLNSSSAGEASESIKKGQSMSQFVQEQKAEYKNISLQTISDEGSSSFDNNEDHNSMFSNQFIFAKMKDKKSLEQELQMNKRLSDSPLVKIQGQNSMIDLIPSNKQIDQLLNLGEQKNEIEKSIDELLQSPRAKSTGNIDLKCNQLKSRTNNSVLIMHRQNSQANIIEDTSIKSEDLAQRQLKTNQNTSILKLINFPDGSMFQGKLSVHGQKEGYGKLVDKDGNIFEGFWIKDKLHGSCKVQFCSGDLYQGQYTNDEQTGIGQMIFAQSNDCYQGQWKNGQMTGHGKYYQRTNDQKIFTGYFYKGEMYGNGIIESMDFFYRGEVKNGLFDGFGRLEDKKTNLVFYGNFQEGQKHGFGQEFTLNSEEDDQSEFEGYWKNDFKNGIGKQVIKNDKKDRITIIENMWKEGEVVEEISRLSAIKSKTESEMKQTRFQQLMSKMNEQKESLSESIRDQNKLQKSIQEKVEIYSLNQQK